MENKNLNTYQSVSGVASIKSINQYPHAKYAVAPDLPDTIPTRDISARLIYRTGYF